MRGSVQPLTVIMLTRDEQLLGACCGVVGVVTSAALDNVGRVKNPLTSFMPLTTELVEYCLQIKRKIVLTLFFFSFLLFFKEKAVLLVMTSLKSLQPKEFPPLKNCYVSLSLSACVCMCRCR